MHMKETIEIGTLTKKELEMMDVLWRSDTALTASEILKASTDKTWKDKSLHILITSLFKKNLIEVAGFKKNSKMYARTFKPTLNQCDYVWHKITAGLAKEKRIELINTIINNLNDDEILIAQQLINKRINQ